MKLPSPQIASVAALTVISVATAGQADTLRSTLSFNNAIQEPAPEQPADGVAVMYPVTLSGGDLDGCTADIEESLFPRDEGAWGIFEIAVEVGCGDGSFAFTSSGAWDSAGFHGAGHVVEGSGSGRFEDISGRIAQIGGALAPGSESGTLDVRYELLVDRAE